MKPNSKEPIPSESHINRVLLIEDEGEMSLVLSLVLNKENMQILHAKTLAEAENFLENRGPDLILLDNRLPDGFGLDFVRYLRANYPTVKIIMISGLDKASENAALEMGAVALLARPFKKETLLRSVSQLLN